MTDTEPAPPAVVDTTIFVRRLQVATLSILSLVLTIHLLEKFRDVLQPLFIALFIVFLMHPVHRWLDGRGIPSMLSYGVIVVLFGLCVTGLGALMYSNFTQVSDNLGAYEERLEKKIIAIVAEMPFETPELEKHFLRNLAKPEQLNAALSAALGRMGDFTTWALMTLVYLVFVIAEKVGFPSRMEQAFGPQQGDRIMIVIDSIILAIGQYIAVKTLVSVLAGLLSYGVLALFDVEFAATWGILIFVLNYIPYLGSLIAVSLPILISFVQFDEIWKGIVIGSLLIGIQQVIGLVVEPRMAGQRLDVSPLLIVLSLAFWGVVWGIIGMILAVPILVTAKIIFDNINETKPIATLISNK